MGLPHISHQQNYGRQICERSHLPEMCDPGDSIMAHKGFNLLVPGDGYIRLEPKLSCRESDISVWDFMESPRETAAL